jgi:hypothetical protein
VGSSGAADRGEHCEVAGAFAQIKKAPTQTTGPSDYQQVSLKTFVGGGDDPTERSDEYQTFDALTG